MIGKCGVPPILPHSFALIPRQYLGRQPLCRTAWEGGCAPTSQTSPRGGPCTRTQCRALAAPQTPEVPASHPTSADYPLSRLFRFVSGSTVSTHCARWKRKCGQTLDRKSNRMRTNIALGWGITSFCTRVFLGCCSVPVTRNLLVRAVWGSDRHSVASRRGSSRGFILAG